MASQKVVEIRAEAQLYGRAKKTQKVSEKKVKSVQDKR